VAIIIMDVRFSIFKFSAPFSDILRSHGVIALHFGQLAVLGEADCIHKTESHYEILRWLMLLMSSLFHTSLPHE